MANPGGGATLAQSAARGAAATLSGRLVRILIQLLGVILLARVLKPSDFGIIGMVVAFTGVGELLRDFGLASATIQSPTLTKSQRDTLFWLSGAMGLAVGAVVWFAAPALGVLYGRPEVVSAAHWLAATFPLNGFTAQYRANLARQLRFSAIQVSDLAPAVAGLSIAVTGGLLGHGYWALVAQQLVQSTGGLLVSSALGRWLPGPPKKGAGVRGFIRYGSGLFGTQLLSYLTKNFDSMIVGYRFGPTSLGYYNRAYDLVINSTNQVIMPSANLGVSVLSRLNNEPNRQRHFLLRGQRALVYVAMLVIALGGALSRQLVEIVLGPAWLPSAPLVVAFVFAAAVNASAQALNWHVLARGLTALQFRVALVTTPLALGAIAVGSCWGASGVAVGLTLGQAALWGVNLVVFTRHAGAPGRAMLAISSRAFTLSLICAAGAYSAANYFYYANIWLSTAGGLLCYLALLGSLAWLPAFRRDLGEVRALRRLLQRGG